MRNITLTPDEESRFWAKVDKSGDCWEWKGKLTRGGYGHFRVGGAGGTNLRVHRISFSLANNMSALDCYVDHICHVVTCVNPDHLRAVTPRQNQENRSGANVSSKTGIRGVSWSVAREKWHVQVSSQGKRHHAGYFDSITDAEEAAIAKRNELHTHNDIDRRVTTL